MHHHTQLLSSIHDYPQLPIIPEIWFESSIFGHADMPPQPRCPAPPSRQAGSRRYRKNEPHLPTDREKLNSRLTIHIASSQQHHLVHQTIATSPLVIMRQRRHIRYRLQKLVNLAFIYTQCILELPLLPRQLIEQPVAHVHRRNSPSEFVHIQALY